MAMSLIVCLFVCWAETDMEDKGCGEMHSQGEKQREYITLLFLLLFLHVIV